MAHKLGNVKSLKLSLLPVLLVTAGSAGAEEQFPAATETEKTFRPGEVPSRAV